MKQDWEKKTLGDVLEVLRNGVNCKQDKKGVGDKISRIESISNADFDIDKVGFATLSSSDKEKYRLIKGDILFSHINSPIHVGKTALFNSDEEVYHGVNLLLMRPKPFLNGSYFEHFLKFLFQNGYWKSVCKQSVNQAIVNQQDINKVEIRYPKSLPEQQRIVSILDAAFAAIDKAKANAEQNLQNAKELFESYLQGVFENGDWETKKLGSLCNLITKGSSPKWQGINYVDEPGILFVTSENVGEGELLLEKRKYVEEKFNQKDKKSILKNGDVLTNIVGASIGRTAIYNIDDVANINQAVCLLRCNPELVNNRFLMNLLNSPFLKAILHDNEVNTARANLSLGFFNQLEIPCPTIEQQQTIVRQLDALRAETQKLEAVYQKKMDDLEELKKSILQKAFRGELVEPAGELETEKVEVI